MIVAGRDEVSQGAEPCALVRERPSMSPTGPGDPVRPREFAPLAQSPTTPEQLKQAVRLSRLGLTYRLAKGRPSAWRNDLTGHPVEAGEGRSARRLNRFKRVCEGRDEGHEVAAPETSAGRRRPRPVLLASWERISA